MYFMANIKSSLNCVFGDFCMDLYVGALSVSFVRKIKDLTVILRVFFLNH